MKALTVLKPRVQAGIVLAALIAAIYTASIVLVPGADTKAETKPDPKTEKSQKTEKKTTKKKLTGAELYSMHCGRCHPQRYATEFTAAQWKTVMFEMRVRANLPAVQAKALLKYLQEDSGK
jgi:hypothetical protein